MSKTIWSEGPLVVGTVNDPKDMEALDVMGTPGCDVVEWRLDGLQDIRRALVQEAVDACPQPVILTARREDEGGFAPWSDEGARRAALEALLTPGHTVDLEARSLGESPAWRESVLAWRQAGVALVVSLHDFDGVPDSACLAEALAHAGAAGAAVFKVAATPRSLDEVVALAEVFALCRGSAPMPSVMAMGHFGRASRLLFGRAGSRLNYGYLRRASVPGQWPVEQLHELLHEA